MCHVLFILACTVFLRFFVLFILVYTAFLQSRFCILRYFFTVYTDLSSIFTVCIASLEILEFHICSFGMIQLGLALKDDF